MFFNILSTIPKSLFWQTPLGFLIIGLIWLFMIHPFFRWAGSWVSWFIMWELSALELIDHTTKQCQRRNGGVFEREPGRLDDRDWIIHHGCVGREEGHDYPIYGVGQRFQKQDGQLTNWFIDRGPFRPRFLHYCRRRNHLGYLTIRPILQSRLPSTPSCPLLLGWLSLPPSWPPLPPGWALRGHQAC
jgi:hypothetical protein